VPQEEDDLTVDQKITLLGYIAIYMVGVCSGVILAARVWL
jgi:hypothetical protein